MAEPINIVNLSGGKDSTAMLLMMLERGIPVHKVLFADVGEMAEFPMMYDYLKRVEEYTGIPITTVRSEKHSVENIFYGCFTRGKRVGEMRGFPPTVGQACSYRRDLKVNPLKIACGKGNNVYIGIAADEEHRSRCKEYAQGKNNYCFPLVEWGITEDDCLEYLRERSLYNELYDYFRRLGCWWCPKQPLSSLKKLWSAFPDLWEELIRMERDQGRPFKYRYSAESLEIRFKRELAKKTEERGGFAA